MVLAEQFRQDGELVGGRSMAAPKEKPGSPGDGDGEGDSGTGMDLQALKQAIVRSRRGKMNVALGQGDPKSGGAGLIMVDKSTPPRQMVKKLKGQFSTASKMCFGTVSVDIDTDPKLVTFKMNKRIPGLDRRVRKSLKGTGFTKVKIEVGGGEPER